MKNKSELYLSIFAISLLVIVAICGLIQANKSINKINEEIQKNIVIYRPHYEMSANEEFLYIKEIRGPHTDEYLITIDQITRIESSGDLTYIYVNNKMFSVVSGTFTPLDVSRAIQKGKK